MTQTYFPFDAGAGSAVTEAQWTKMARQWLATGVITGETNLLEVFADSSGMQVKVRSGVAWVRGHYFESDAEEILSITAADPSNPRIDRVVIRVDFTNNTVALAVLAGTAAASPSAPALTQSSSTWEISLAQVRVEAAVSSIAANKITDERAFAGPRPLRVVSKTAAYTATGDDWMILVDATAGAVTVTLPTAVGVLGRQYVVKKIDSSANAVTVDPNGAETIDGSATAALRSQNEALVAASDNANWRRFPGAYITNPPPAASGTPDANAVYQQSLVKAWGHFTISGGVITTTDHHNIASTTYNALGDFTVTFDRDFASANYAVTGAAGSTNTIGLSTHLAGSVRLVGFNTGGSSSDPAQFSLIAAGDQ